MKKSKSKSKDTYKIGFWEEIHGEMALKDMCDAEEITVPGTAMKVFYIKKKDLWLPRFTRGGFGMIEKVKLCYNSEFNGVPCLEDDERYGFFKDDVDRRPSSCIWIDKIKLEHFFNQYVDVYSQKKTETNNE